MSSGLPAGNVTFLFTDIAGSTKLLQQLGGDRYGKLLADQRVILRAAFEQHGGREVDTQGDSFFASFPRASDAVSAAAQIQRALVGHDWPGGVNVQVRAGLHTGEPRVAEEGYVGMDVHRAARIGHVGHGGQVLLSAATRALVSDDLPEGTSLLDLGEHLLKDLRTPKRIFQLNIDGLPTDFPPLTGGRPNNLPHQTTPFIGRGDELAALDELIADPSFRLITILGPGGMGKSRLALTVAEAQLYAQRKGDERRGPRFPQGAFFVALAPLSSSDQIIPAIAEALDFKLEGLGGVRLPGQEPRPAQKQLLDYLRNKQLLLVLDNYEHLLDGARVALDILKNAPGVQILATSRERLGLQSEQVFWLEGMSHPQIGDDPDQAFSAVALFENRARLVRPEFESQAAEREDLGKICRLVGGMPLAIELAAAWVEVLSLQDIAAEIQRGLDLLETQWDDVPERHRSIKSVFESTFERLSAGEQAIFQKVSVFRGGFTRQAAEEIAGAPLITLTRLVHKSILHYSRSRDRYEIHELLRQFGAEKLAQNNEMQRNNSQRHAEFFCAYIETQGTQLHGPQQMEAQENFRNDLDNILEAWAWASRNISIELLDQAANGLGFYFFFDSVYDKPANVFRLAADRLAHLKIPHGRRVWAKVATWQADYLSAEENARRIQLLTESETVLSDLGMAEIDTRGERAFVLESLAYREQNHDARLHLHQQALEIYMELGDSVGIAENLGNIAFLNHRTGNKETAYQQFEECMDLWRSMGDRIGLSSLLESYFWLVVLQGRLEPAEKAVDETFAIRDSLGILDLSPQTFYIRGFLDLLKGDFQDGFISLERCIEIAEERGLSTNKSLALQMIAEIHLHLGDYRLARETSVQAMELAQRVGYTWITGYAHYVLGKADLAQGRYSEASKHLQKSGEIYEPLGDIEIGYEVMATRAYGPAGSLGPRQQLELILTPLKTAIKNHSYLTLLSILMAYVKLEISLNQPARAVEIYEMASRQDFVANSHYFADIIGKQVLQASKTLHPEELAAVKARGQQRELWETAEELLAELEAFRKPGC